MNSSASQRMTLPMSVARMSFLVERLHQDCHPLQYLRELTKNAIESIERLENPVGEIHWDVDHVQRELGGHYKLTIIDTGVGMTGEEMVEYINKLSSSIHAQSATGNFGVGAKISAAPLNPEGMVYLSWKDGVGYMIHLYKDDFGEYGLRRHQNGEYWQKVEETLKPAVIKDHGTAVVLLGSSTDANTIDPPSNVRMPRKWILRYLNSRFFRLPPGVKLKVREGWDLPDGDKHNFLRTVTGQGDWLDQNSDRKGITQLPEMGARVHWWIINDGVDTNSGHYTTPGHVGALFQDEVYELKDGNAGIARLQAFGIVFGGNRVVLYLEPISSAEQQVHANTARTQLLLNNEALPWSDYAAAFRAVMPQELADYQDEIGSSTRDTDHRAAIRERLKAFRDLFKFGRYRPDKGGASRVETSHAAGGAPGRSDLQQNGAAKSGGRGGRQGDLYSLFAENEGEPATLVDSWDEPDTIWLSDDENTGDPSLEGYAARFLFDQNRLLINGDFRVFTDMVDRWSKRYEHCPGSQKTVKDTVREWFEQQLIETVMSALALKQSGPMSTNELRELWSETALTAAVLPRYHIELSVKRVLGQRLGKLASAA